MATTKPKNELPISKPIFSLVSATQDYRYRYFKLSTVSVPIPIPIPVSIGPSLSRRHVVNCDPFLIDIANGLCGLDIFHNTCFSLVVA